MANRNRNNQNYCESFRSGAKLRAIRKIDVTTRLKRYANQETVISVTDRFRRLDREVVNVVHLTPQTSENRSILAVELRSDKQTRKPGIFIIGGIIQ